MCHKTEVGKVYCFTGESLSDENMLEQEEVVMYDTQGQAVQSGSVA